MKKNNNNKKNKQQKMKKLKFKTAMLRTTLLTLALVSSVMGAKAESYYTDGKLYYTIDGENATVVAPQGGNTYSGDITIGEQVTLSGNTYKVVAIADNAFKNTGITEITVPISVTSVGYGAFSNCINLKTATLNCNITKLATATFMEDKFLTDVKLPSTLEKIESSAFNQCYSLTKIELPENITEIHQSAFATTSLPEGVDLNNAEDLKKYFPEIVAIKDYLDYLKTQPKNDENDATIAALEAMLEGYDLENITSKGLSEINLEDTKVTELAFNTFNQTKLQSITLPSTLKTIGKSVFANSPINNIVWHTTKISSIEATSFDNPSTITATVPFDYKNVFTAAGFAEGNITVDENGGYKRTVTEGNWGTICLPYALDVERDSEYGAEFYAIDRKIVNGTEVTALELVQLEEGKTMEAGVPYFFKATGTQLVLPYKDFYTTEAKPATSNNGLYGAIEATDISEADITDGVYMLKNNTLYKAATGSKCGANRAYVKMSKVSTGSHAPVAAKRVQMSVTGSTTGIISLESDQTNDAPEAVYDLLGRRVNINAAQRGIYIINGKKVLK